MHFSDTGIMKESSDWKIAKWPFLLAGVLLLAVAAVLACRPAHAITPMEVILATVSVALGALLACLPFILEYRATARLIEVNALGSVSEKFADLEKFAAQVSDATGQWARVQETTQGSAEKTIAAAREISERMAAEVREFNEFQAKLNDSEKATLRLEVEKLRRAEGEWLQVLARILDHIYALHNAAARSGQPELASQIANFQHACRDTARRVGLVPFEAEPGEPFDAQKHRVHGEENPPADAVTAETLAPGLTFQGRLLRPALVRLQTAPPPASAAETPAEPAPAQLTLEAE
jgi:molecular chaperone GrpE (heat shock protein)